MPLLGSVLPEQVEPLYFKSLEELDKWFSSPRADFDAVLRYHPRSSEPNNHGKLLVCHDYKGGYTESPHSFGYTFNFWSLCDTFVYFSHHRVTIPPPGWITAAHRQGVKMLGTLIFEGGGEEDCLRLLVGKLPKSKSGPALPSSAPPSLPLSPHYARILAELAKQRGFDGYLLNFECPLQGGIEQTRTLAAWITILQRELHERVGKHAEVSWYDSVVFTGQLAWQDRLNSYNLPFFLSSSSIFTNYTWRNHYPSLTAQYFLTLDSSLVSNPHAPPKTLRDIYVGIDIWGRGSHGNGGFGAYKALSHIEPSSLGLSVAIFGQAWSWESEQDKPGFTWDSWWDHDRKLWTGVIDSTETVQIPESAQKRGESPCTHGDFAPFKDFFIRQAPPNVDDLPFHTTFCPGVGRKWFVDGKEVFARPDGSGWTDVDKQTSVGDLVWPKPAIEWDAQADAPQGVELPNAKVNIDMENAWNGGSCLRILLSDPGSQSENAVFRCVRVPVQSLMIRADRTYEATAIYKVEGNVPFDVDISLSMKSMSSTDDLAFQVTPCSENDSQLDDGWVKLAIQFTVPGGNSPSTETDISLGFTFAIVAEDPSQPFELPILLGQINVHPAYPTIIPKTTPMILWADFNRRLSSTSDLSGTVSFEIAASLPHQPQPRITSPEDPISAWAIQPSATQWFPRLLYANVYAQAYEPASTALPGTATWIGTTSCGFDGRKNVFDIQQENMPPSVYVQGRKGKSKVRVYVQGVLDTGEVMKWERCAYADIDC